MSTLEPGILKALRKANGDMSAAVIAGKIDARTGWVARALVELAKQGKVIRTRDTDDDGRGPFYRLLTLDTIPEASTDETERETEEEVTSTAVQEVHTTMTVDAGLIIAQPTPSLNSSPGPLLAPMALLSDVENLARRAGFTVRYVEFQTDMVAPGVITPVMISLELSTLKMKA